MCERSRSQRSLGKYFLRYPGRSSPAAPDILESCFDKRRSISFSRGADSAARDEKRDPKNPVRAILRAAVFNVESNSGRLNVSALFFAKGETTT